jgi:hypothetical protein
MPKYQGGSAIRLFRSQDAFDSGALPGPVCPQQAKDRTGLDRQVQTFQHGFSLIAFGKALCPDSFFCLCYSFAHLILLFLVKVCTATAAF